MVKIQAEVVNGKCPTCDEFTMLVGLTPELYRCMNCGSDLQQHVNGKITYLPVLTAREDGGVPFVKEWLEQCLKNLNTGYPQHLVINLRNVRDVTKNQEINKKKDSKKNKRRVDNNPQKSYIVGMKEKQLTITSSNITQKQWSNLILELNLIKKAWSSYATIELQGSGVRKIIAHGTRTNFKED